MRCQLRHPAQLLACAILIAAVAACAPTAKRRPIVTGTIERPPAPMAPIEYDRPRTEPLITPDNDPFAAD